MEENTIHADGQNKRKKLISRIITTLIFVGFGVMFFCFPIFRKTIISEKFINSYLMWNLMRFEGSSQTTARKTLIFFIIGNSI